MTDKTHYEEKDLSRRDRYFGGTIFIVIGLLALLANATRSEAFGLLFLPALGVLFLGWGFYTREYGFAIPGGILTGLGTGLVFAVRVLTLDGAAVAGVIVLGLAAGFLSLSLIAPYFGQRRMAWPLIPSGVLGLIGALLVSGDAGLSVLTFIGNVWPVILVAVGLVVLFWPRQRK